MACVGCSFDSFSILRLSLKNNKISWKLCFPVSIFQYGHVPLKYWKNKQTNKNLYFILVNCMGWQVWVSTRLNEVGIESSDTKQVDGHKQPPKRSRPNGRFESCHVSRMVTLTGIWSQSEYRFPDPSSKLCQIWLRHWKGTLYLCAAVPVSYTHLTLPTRRWV